MDHPLNIDDYEKYFLAIAVWREGRGEGYEGMLAIAYVLLTRAANPRWWGHNLGEVIAQPSQISSMTYPNDRNLTKWPTREDPSFYVACLAAVNDALSGARPNPAPGADHYHAAGVRPIWAKPEHFVARIGNHLFFSLEEKENLP